MTLVHVVNDNKNDNDNDKLTIFSLSEADPGEHTSCSRLVLQMYFMYNFKLQEQKVLLSLVIDEGV